MLDHTAYTSNFYKNFIGESYAVYIVELSKNSRIIYILDQSGDVQYKHELTKGDLLYAKRQARKIMITRFKVRLSDEIRRRK